MNGWRMTAARLLWRFRFVLALACVVATGVAASQLTSLAVSNALDVWYPEDHPELVRYRSFLDTWGSDELVIVAATSRTGSSFLTGDGNDLIGQMTDALLDVAGVATVTSRVTVPESLSDVRGRLLSDDGRTTVLLVQLLQTVTTDSTRHAVLVEINDSVSKLGVQVRLAGYGVIYDALNEASTSGSATLIVTAHGVMILLLTVFFRRGLPVLVILLAVGMAATWTMGIYVALDQQLNMVTMALPTLVLVIGVTDCLHIFRSVARQSAGHLHAERVVRGVGAVLGPCLLTSLTTAAGFLALASSSLPVVQNLGFFGAIGMLCAFLASFIVATAGLSTPAALPARRGSAIDWFSRTLCAAGHRYPWRTIGVFVVIGIVATGGLTRLETDTSSIAYLDPGHKIRRDSDYIERAVGPYLPIEFLVTRVDGVLNPGVLDAIQAWQSDAEQLDAIGWSWCLIDALGIGRETRPSSLGEGVVRARFARLQRFSPVTSSSMISGDTQLRVSFGAPVLSARDVQALVDELESRARFPAGVELTPAGYAPLYTRIVDELVMSQVYGFAVALALIATLIGLAMGSLWRLLLAIPANAVPVLVTLGLMGLIGVPLDVATATIATVILGLVVDDTVHLLRPGPGQGLTSAIRNAAAQSGGTLLMTTLILAGGLAVLGLAGIRSVAWFGLLSAFAMLVAILTDLMLLPALARILESTKHNVLIDKRAITS